MTERIGDKFLALPVDPAATWQVGFVFLAELLDLDPAELDLGLVLLRCHPSGFVHAKPALGGAGEPHDHLMSVMNEMIRMRKLRSRPVRIECNDRESVEKLAELLAGSGTSVSYEPEMTEWNDVMLEMMKHFDKQAPAIPSLRDAGCGDGDIREFADASAAFFRARLWDHLDDSDLIQFEAPKAPRHLKFAGVLGAGAQTYGLGFFDSTNDHDRMMTERLDPARIGVFSLTFESPAEATPGDVALWNELELPLETGEAFPSMHFFSKNQCRRPTPKELAFTTAILKALAATSEDDIDSGRWTKSVEVSGRMVECVQSIPNLTDPPDRAEWIRRGKMPDHRGNERAMSLVQAFVNEHAGEMNVNELNAAINERFTGPLDELELPMETPAQRADALCQQALDTFGRRRIQLAKQALAEDPAHVEAHVLLAETTRAPEHRLQLFQRAIDAAKKHMGSEFEENVGHFWGVLETRPFMRACQGLAEALIEDCQPREAIAQYQEMLRLNPNDNQGIRYELIPLLISNGRDAEAKELLDRYVEESAHWLHMKALIEFCRQGPGADWQEVIRAAFRANEYVVERLLSDEPLPMPDNYAWGSPEEAEVCIELMSDAWAGTEDYEDWMIREHEVWKRETIKRKRERTPAKRAKASHKKRSSR